MQSLQPRSSRTPPSSRRRLYSRLPISMKGSSRRQRESAWVYDIVVGLQKISTTSPKILKLRLTTTQSIQGEKHTSSLRGGYMGDSCQTKYMLEYLVEVAQHGFPLSHWRFRELQVNSWHREVLVRTGPTASFNSIQTLHTYWTQALESQ